ncbi:hypothetical protein BH23PLA1_BH23PLA1_04680 [soil metagenome]
MSQPPEDRDRNAPAPVPLPGLPVIQIDPVEQKSQAEKYGALYYLAIVGLLFLISLIAWFGYGVWSLRDVWKDVYLLHDPARSEVDRVNAALRLARNPDTTQRQLYDITLRTEPPPLARYLLAEALTVEAMTGDPRGYAMAIARSEGWPDWLRLLHLRPLAYGAGQGEAITQQPLRELTEHDDPILRLWAFYTLAESLDTNHFARDALSEAAETGPHDDLARILIKALDADDPEQIAQLDLATQWVRSQHPEAVRIWEGWAFEDEGDRLVRRP